MHKRLVPKVNQFVYEVFYICFDIAKINNLSKKIFSINKFNLFSFYEKDYGPKDGSSIENWAWNILKNQQILKFLVLLLITVFFKNRKIHFNSVLFQVSVGFRAPSRKWGFPISPSRKTLRIFPSPSPDQESSWWMGWVPDNDWSSVCLALIKCWWLPIVRAL